jgi:hypothetical protein
MISCRTQYKSYTDENTHIHVLYPDRLPYAPLVRTRGASVQIDPWRCASKGRKVSLWLRFQCGSMACSYTVSQ